jgi:transketolase
VLKMNKTTQRDSFFNRLYELAGANRDILLVSADMGAPSLDRYRTDLALQYIDVGIAEQQAAALAAGLAFSGKKVFAYQIAPFISLRCYEHIRVSIAAMNLPVTLVGVGAGVSYPDSGPTHHAVEDISVLRILPNLKIHNMTDPVMARAFAEISCELEHPNYIRLDRQVDECIYDEYTDFSAGFHVHSHSQALCLVATGNMVHRALVLRDALAEQGLEAGVVDVFTFPIPGGPLSEVLADTAKVVTLEEHTLPGGMGGNVLEVMADHGVVKPVKRLGMDFRNSYCYRYGGRENILTHYGLDHKSALDTIINFCQ